MTRVPVTVARAHVLIPFWARAQVLRPREILVRHGVELDARLLAHELAHVIQRERLGRWFDLVYVWQWATVGFRYSRIPLEVEARAAEVNRWYLAWASGVMREVECGEG